MEALILVLLIAGFVAEGQAIVCNGDLVKRILNFNHRSDLTLESNVTNIEDMLKGSGKALHRTGTFQFTIRAEGMRQTPSALIKKGYWPKRICFLSKCVQSISENVVWRSPDPVSGMDSQGNVQWGRKGGGTGYGYSFLPNVEKLTLHCLNRTAAFDRITFGFGQIGLPGIKCPEMEVKGFYMRACVDKN